MIVSVCTTSSETQFAALGDLMVLLGATASSSGMDLALTQATGWTERYITNSVAGSIRRSVVMETVAGSGSQQLMLARTPIQAIQRLFDSSSTCSGGSTEYCSTDYRIGDADAGFLELTGGRSFWWDAIWDQNLSLSPRPSATVRPWLVVYEAGWQLVCASSTGKWVSVTTGRTLPDDVERAVLLKAAEFYQGSASGIERMKVGPLEVNYSSAGMDPVVALLAPYRRL